MSREGGNGTPQERMEVGNKSGEAEEVLSYWFPKTSLMLISKRCGVTVSDGWPEAPRSIGRLPKDSVHY